MTGPYRNPAPCPAVLWLSGAAVFLAATLLFVVQPLAARSLLPWYGGAPMVWAVALFFFQAVLLGGYLYAHLLVTRLAPRVQLAVHGILLVLAALASLPPLPGTGWAPDGGEAPAGWILLTLLVTVWDRPSSRWRPPRRWCRRGWPARALRQPTTRRRPASTGCMPSRMPGR